jgi:NAD(P)-dependent dehydrogenase (short-subunit alcohol dehydrogenase family)
LAVVTDVSKEADTNNLFAEVSKTFGRAADVVFASAGVGPPPVPLAEDDVKTWWSTFVSCLKPSINAKPAQQARRLTVYSQEINVLGVHNTVASWINSQPDPKKPIGTVININSGMAGFIVPGHSAYSVSKLTAHRYMEYVAAGALAPIHLSNTRNINGSANAILP